MHFMRFIHPFRIVAAQGKAIPKTIVKRQAICLTMTLASLFHHAFFSLESFDCRFESHFEWHSSSYPLASNMIHVCKLKFWNSFRAEMEMRRFWQRLIDPDHRLQFKRMRKRLKSSEKTDFSRIDATRHYENKPNRWSTLSRPQNT